MTDLKQEIQSWWDNIDPFLAGTKFQDADVELFALIDSVRSSTLEEDRRRAAESAGKFWDDNGLTIGGDAYILLDDAFEAITPFRTQPSPTGE